MAWPVERAAKRNRASENRGGGGENGGAVSFQSILKRYRGLAIDECRDDCSPRIRRFGW